VAILKPGFEEETGVEEGRWIHPGFFGKAGVLKGQEAGMG
jgi:hypothetical protein